MQRFRPEEIRACRDTLYELVKSGRLGGELSNGKGGDGGSGEAYGDRNTIIGGRGGESGVGGGGGKGGGGIIHGNDGLIIGGDGGSCGTPDGRGGRGARGPTERLGFPTELWGSGGGGSAANAPEYDRRISLLKSIRAEYLQRFPDRAPFIEAGVDQVPIDWVNQRLTEVKEAWRVEAGSVVGYVLPPLAG